MSPGVWTMKVEQHGSIIPIFSAAATAWNDPPTTVSNILLDDGGIIYPHHLTGHCTPLFDGTGNCGVSVGITQRLGHMFGNSNPILLCVWGLGWVI